MADKGASSCQCFGGTEHQGARLNKHKACIWASRCVTRYSLRLLPDLYKDFYPLRCEDAADKKIVVGIDPRSAGFGARQA